MALKKFERYNLKWENTFVAKGVREITRFNENMFAPLHCMTEEEFNKNNKATYTQSYIRYPTSRGGYIAIKKGEYLALSGLGYWSEQYKRYKSYTTTGEVYYALQYTEDDDAHNTKGYVGNIYKRTGVKDVYVDTIIAEEGTYPANGIKDGYWYTDIGYANRPPTISGNDYDYKSVTDDFEIEYLLTDTDADDIVNVDILQGLVGSLGEKVREHKAISLGMKYKYLVPAKSLPIGNYFVKIVATDKEGAKSERNYLFERVNSIPLITSTLSTKLGDKNTGFTIPYKVSDTNVDDKLSVTVRINNKTVDQKANVKHNEELYFTVTNEMLLSYELNKEVTIEIEVVDDKGASNRLIFTFTRTNALPIISDNDKDLGSFEVSPEFKFSISDTEKDEIFYSLYLDDKKLEDQLTIEDGEEKIYKFSHDDWIKIDPSKNHIFRIVATDKHAIEIAGENEPQTVERKFTFKRICNRLEVNFKIAESIEKQEELDTTQLKGLVGRVTAMTLTPDIVVAGGAIVKYLVTNNGNDENPTWENATDSVLAGAKYFFTNETKTTEKWLYMVKVIVERNTAAENSRLKALAGSWGYNDYTM